MAYPLRIAPMRGFLLLLTVSCAALACSSASEIGVRADEIRAVVEPRRARAEVCSPRDLAYAEVLSVVAAYDSSRGRGMSARQAVEAATEHAKSVYSEVESGGERCAPDADFDRIPDSVDQCRLEPEDRDGMEDDDGCPESDRDGDLVSDRRDRCLAEPEDRDGFQDDDGCPDPDNDNDGVADGADRCPLDPEDRDNHEDLDGCPDPDNDGDGIVDGQDRCPLEPEDVDGDDDADGCPDLYRDIVVQDNAIVLKKKVFFATNKTAILSDSFPMLIEVADVLARNSAMRVRIEGHTDSKGSDKRNILLSQGRADAVRRFLIGQGALPDQMVSVGLGETAPLAENDTEAGRAINRRVEFHILTR